MIENKIKVGSAVFIFVLAIVLAGCVGQPPSPTPTPTPTATPTPTPTVSPTATPTPKHPEIKIALILPGSITDRGWDQDPYEGFMQAKKDFGITAEYTEGTDITGTAEDYPRIIRDYCRRGFQLIIAHGFQYRDAVKEAAKDYPNVWFTFDGSAEDITSNTAPWISLGHEPAYLAGILAAKMTKSKIVGVYNGMPVPIEVPCMEAFKAGVHSVDPNIKILSTYIGVWHDVQKGYDTASSMIDAGADVIYGIGDGINVGGQQACKEKGVWFIGGTGGIHQVEGAPDITLASVSWGLDRVIYHLVKIFVENGKLEPKFYQYSMHTTITEKGKRVGPYFVWNMDLVNKGVIPKDVYNLIESTKEDIMKGLVQVPLVFTAPEAQG